MPELVQWLMAAGLSVLVCCGVLATAAALGRRGGERTEAELIVAGAACRRCGSTLEREGTLYVVGGELRCGRCVDARAPARRAAH